MYLYLTPRVFTQIKQYIDVELKFWHSAPTCQDFFRSEKCTPLRLKCRAFGHLGRADLGLLTILILKLSEGQNPRGLKGQKTPPSGRQGLIFYLATNNQKRRYAKICHTDQNIISIYFYICNYICNVFCWCYSNSDIKIALYRDKQKKVWW